MHSWLVRSETRPPAADKLAKQSAKGGLRSPLTQVSVRRKRTSESMEAGSVRLSNQRLTIRVITCEYLRVQHLWKYKYEVMSPKSPYFGKVDVAFSEDVGCERWPHLLRTHERRHRWPACQKPDS